MLLFLLLVIAMFLRCCCRRLCLSPPFFPPDLPSYQAFYFSNNVIFQFSAVLFSHWLFFMADLYVAVFADCGDRFLCPVVSARFVRSLLFFFALFFCFGLKCIERSLCLFVCDIFALFVCFLAGLLCFFLVCCFLAVVVRGKYRRPGPWAHPYALFTCPPILNWPTQFIPTIGGHICTSSLVCVLAVCVHVYFW